MHGKRTFISCETCHSECEVEGEYPRFSAYCNKCEKSVDNFDVLEYCADYISEQIDAIYDRMKDEGIDNDETK